MKKIMLIGSNGQVGWELKRTLAPLGRLYAFDHTSLNLLNIDQIRQKVGEIHPDVIVNAAAYTAVDLAETELDLAMAINGTAPKVLAEEAKKIKALLIHYSTDYVFDGCHSQAYVEVDSTNPLNVYGKTKLAGEEAIQSTDGSYLILRTSWVYGTRGKNFLLTMLRLGKEKESLKIVMDQIGAPTWSRMIAEATSQIISIRNSLSTSLSGVYHLTASGQTTWLDFAKTIFKLYKEKAPDQNFKVQTFQGIPSADYPTPALRPKNSQLSLKKMEKDFGIFMPTWNQGLELCLEELLLRP